MLKNGGTTSSREDWSGLSTQGDPKLTGGETVLSSMLKLHGGHDLQGHASASTIWHGSLFFLGLLGTEISQVTASPGITLIGLIHEPRNVLSYEFFLHIHSHMGSKN